MCASITALSNARSYFNEALTPAQIPSKWGDKKVYAILQQTFFCTSYISLVTALFSAVILSAPLFLASTLAFSLSIIASYNFKKLSIFPQPSISIERTNELVEESIEEIEHENPQSPEPELVERLNKHVQVEFFPNDFTEAEKEELRNDHKEVDDVPMTLPEIQEIEQHVTTRRKNRANRAAIWDD